MSTMIMAALNFIFSFLHMQSKIHAEPKCFFKYPKRYLSFKMLHLV